MTEAFPVPRLVAWEVTRRCNLRCRHCRASAEDCAYAGELSFEEAKRFVDDLASIAKPILILTGGEPLLCEWLYDIIAYARSKGMRPVIGTNATLITADTARRIADLGVLRISVSLDFPTAAEHDGFRGVDGAFEAARRGIAEAIKAGIEVQINTTVTKLNHERIAEMHDLAESIGAKAFHPFLLVPTGRGAGLSDVELSSAEYESALEWVCRRSATSPMELKPTDAPQYQRIIRQQGMCSGHGSRGCLAGTGFAFVSHTGDVQPCGYFDLRLGNIRQMPFSRIWRDSPVLDDLRHPERLKGKCGVCEYRPVCGGCRARALAKTGDYLAQEPYCAHIPDRVFLREIQENFPITPRPYAEIGSRLGISEGAVYERIADLHSRGYIRRIGALWNPGRFGYATTLVACEVEMEHLDEVAAFAAAYDEVTHDYSREGRYNLWFTVIAESREDIERIKLAVSKQTGVRSMMELPKKKTYKLRAVFG